MSLQDDINSNIADLSEDEKIAAERERDAEKKLRNAYALVFSTPQGNLVLEDMKEMFFMYRTTFVAAQVAEAGLDPLAYNEGQRSVPLYIEEMRRSIELIEEEKG